MLLFTRFPVKNIEQYDFGLLARLYDWVGARCRGRAHPNTAKARITVQTMVRFTAFGRRSTCTPALQNWCCRKNKG